VHKKARARVITPRREAPARLKLANLTAYCSSREVGCGRFRHGNSTLRPGRPGRLAIPRVPGLIFLVFSTLFSGTVFYSLVEGWSPLDSFYFCIITLTTVGYGDLAPTTAVGKVFTVLYILVGLGILLTFIDAVAEISLRRRGIDRDQARRRAQDTPR
jgi:voltage-gated potassium channel